MSVQALTDQTSGCFEFTKTCTQIMKDSLHWSIAVIVLISVLETLLVRSLIADDDADADDSWAMWFSKASTIANLLGTFLVFAIVMRVQITCARNRGHGPIGCRCSRRGSLA